MVKNEICKRLKYFKMLQNNKNVFRNIKLSLNNIILKSKKNKSKYNYKILYYNYYD